MPENVILHVWQRFRILRFSNTALKFALEVIAERTLIKVASRPVRSNRVNQCFEGVSGRAPTSLDQHGKLTFRERTWVIKSNVVFKSNLRFVDFELMAWSLTTPDYGMLPLHMFEPFIRGLKHGSFICAVFK